LSNVGLIVPKKNVEVILSFSSSLPISLTTQILRTDWRLAVPRERIAAASERK